MRTALVPTSVAVTYWWSRKRSASRMETGGAAAVSRSGSMMRSERMSVFISFAVNRAQPWPAGPHDPAGIGVAQGARETNASRQYVTRVAPTTLANLGRHGLSRARRARRGVWGHEELTICDGGLAVADLRGRKPSARLRKWRKTCAQVLDLQRFILYTGQMSSSGYVCR
jgi:hypothetical protein